MVSLSYLVFLLFFTKVCESSHISVTCGFKALKVYCEVPLNLNQNHHLNTAVALNVYYNGILCVIGRQFTELKFVLSIKRKSSTHFKTCIPKASYTPSDWRK